MFIQAFPSGPFETNAYVVACPTTRHAAIIDPAPGCAQTVIQFLTNNNLSPKAIWLTHSHWDHIADAAVLKKHYSIPLLVHPLDAQNMIQPGSDKLPCWISIEGTTPDSPPLEEGVALPLGNLTFHVIHTPGHTPGGVCFYCPEKEILISGDTLFRGSIGNTSFATGQPELMWQSLNKLATLPPETRVYPGHGNSTTIGKENWLPRAKEIFG